MPRKAGGGQPRRVTVKLDAAIEKHDRVFAVLREAVSIAVAGDSSVTFDSFKGQSRIGISFAGTNEEYERVANMVFWIAHGLDLPYVDVNPDAIANLDALNNAYYDLEEWSYSDDEE